MPGVRTDWAAQLAEWILFFLTVVAGLVLAVLALLLVFWVGMTAWFCVLWLWGRWGGGRPPRDGPEGPGDDRWRY